MPDFLAAVLPLPSSDHVSMGGFAARKSLRVVAHVEYVVAIELLCACQAIDMMRPLKVRTTRTRTPHARGATSDIARDGRAASRTRHRAHWCVGLPSLVLSLLLLLLLSFDAHVRDSLRRPLRWRLCTRWFARWLRPGRPTASCRPTSRSARSWCAKGPSGRRCTRTSISSSTRSRKGAHWQHAHHTHARTHADAQIRFDELTTGPEQSHPPPAPSAGQTSITLLPPLPSLSFLAFPSFLLLLPLISRQFIQFRVPAPRRSLCIRHFHPSISVSLLSISPSLPFCAPVFRRVVSPCRTYSPLYACMCQLAQSCATHAPMHTEQPVGPPFFENTQKFCFENLLLFVQCKFKERRIGFESGDKRSPAAAWCARERSRAGSREGE